jgi:predicted acylesterase/phospholipase RssA
MPFLAACTIAATGCHNHVTAFLNSTVLFPSKFKGQIMDARTPSSDPAIATGWRPDRCNRVALVLQGGGALGAYQAGAYEALCEAGHMPRWVAGISIGAVNAAIIAGNPPERRAARLRTFWERVSSRLLASPLARDDNSRRIFNETSATLAAVGGVPGFFEPRIPPAVFMPQGTPQAISVYDTEPLKSTLLELVDFDLLNSGAVRISIGAVQVLTGNMKYFDTAKQTIGPEHIMASGARTLRKKRRPSSSRRLTIFIVICVQPAASASASAFVPGGTSSE